MQEIYLYEMQRISGGQDNAQDRERYQNMLQSVWP